MTVRKWEEEVTMARPGAEDYLYLCVGRLKTVKADIDIDIDI